MSNSTTAAAAAGHAELIRRARELVPALSEHAGKSESPFQVPEESLELIRAAGFLRLSTPAAHGGC